MEIKTKSTRMYSLVFLYDLHTDFFGRAIDGISDEAAQNRQGTKANHIAWITGSMVQERFEMAKQFGVDMKQGAHELFKDHKGIQEGVTYPSLAEYKKDWEIISPIYRNALINVSNEKLNSTYEMEGMSMPYFDLFAFMTYREASCIGQIALLRRQLGYAAMNYM